MTREVFVLEKHGEPKAAEVIDRWQLQNRIDAGVRLGVPPGEEQVVRYVPENADLRVSIIRECALALGESGDFHLEQGESWLLSYFNLSTRIPRPIEATPAPGSTADSGPSKP